MKNKQRTLDFSLMFVIRKRSKIISVIMIFAFLNLTVGCTFYKTKQIPTNSDNFVNKYRSINKNDRYVIIHSGSDTWHLNNVVLNEDKKEITGSLQELNEYHKLLSYKGKKISKQSYKSSKAFELHFYTKENLDKNTTSEVIIPFSNIEKMEAYVPDTGKKVLSILGFTFAGLALVGILVAVLKSSCPFVYIKNGDAYTFTGELYPGAILPNLERTDYLPLPDFIPQNAEYTLKISNELKEIQYTDLAQLVVLNHAENTSVLLDQNGKPHSFSNTINPQQVTIDGATFDAAPSLKKDNISYLFDHERSKDDQWNNIILSFDNINYSKQAKLVLSAKNSLWLDLVYGKFNEQFGFYFNRFQKQQHNVPAEKNIQWRNDQGIPLSVYLKSDKDWVLIEKINPAGPMAFRDLIIPIDLEKINAKKIELKLECGFMFWEVDYAAIDYSKNSILEPQYISPFSAIDENGKNVTALLDKEDKNYLIQPNIGNEVVLKYRVKAHKKGERQTVFLKNRGYYEYIRNYSGIPNFSKLKTFREKGALSKYSKEEYYQFTGTKNLSEIVFNHE
ncbi:hypothetical protein H4V97_001266 [Flavobacterium sp. CG_23.5]|uniref:hypothetical protein n=1 Tax=Flavobacterium sp. CG_23.5 TaxID=2760708 RepID=UPI001AE35596|nr:hypothetical protein [Flavobacterium sp. CG_23.5]MBP2282948.1 hypothetical protein [Flavobacterium sp. CG_23.5]